MLLPVPKAFFRISHSDESENIYSNVGSTVRNDSFGIKIWKLSN